jgi:hypothetical protein
MLDLVAYFFFCFFYAVQVLEIELNGPHSSYVEGDWIALADNLNQWFSDCMPNGRTIKAATAEPGQ